MLYHLLARSALVPETHSVPPLSVLGHLCNSVHPSLLSTRGECRLGAASLLSLRSIRDDTGWQEAFLTKVYLYQLAAMFHVLLPLFAAFFFAITQMCDPNAFL